MEYVNAPGRDDQAVEKCPFEVKFWIEWVEFFDFFTWEGLVLLFRLFRDP